MPDNSLSVREDFDPQLMDFLRSKVNSFIKWDLVRFFHDNPHTADTAENIARYMGRDVPTIERELEGLIESEVILSSEVNGFKIYRLTDDETSVMLIRDFIAACHDRQFRVKAIQHVINGMQFTPRHDF